MYSNEGEYKGNIMYKNGYRPSTDSKTAMDAHLEKHLPLITARLVFAHRALPPPPTITQRMSFPLIDTYARSRETTPRPLEQANTTPTTPNTPSIRIIVPRKVNVVRSSEAPSQQEVLFVSSGSSSNSDNEEMNVDDDDDDGPFPRKLIMKPKGDATRPGRGGYSLNEALGWNQKTYDSVLVSEFAVE